MCFPLNMEQKLKIIRCLSSTLTPAREILRLQVLLLKAIFLFSFSRKILLFHVQTTRLFVQSKMHLGALVACREIISFQATPGTLSECFPGGLVQCKCCNCVNKIIPDFFLIRRRSIFRVQISSFLFINITAVTSYEKSRQLLAVL